MPIHLRPSTVSSYLTLAAVFGAGVLAGPHLGVSAQPSARVYELRTYTAPEGKLANLHQRFRDHTLRIFAKHGMTNVIYMAPLDAPLKDNTLVYLLAHESREAARASWAAFSSDPEWKKVSAESQVDGPIVSKVQSIFLQATDYSPMK